MNDDQLRELYRTVKTIATVGYSTQPAKPAYYVPEYLSLMGFHVIPVNPTIQEGLGQKAFPDLLAIPEPVDVVQVFRRPDQVPAIVDQAIQIGAKVVWMQPGAANPAAAQVAQTAGLTVVMDKCMMIEHKRLFGTK